MDKDTRRELIEEIEDKRWEFTSEYGAFNAELIADFILERERSLEERVKVLEADKKIVLVELAMNNEYQDSLHEKIGALENQMAIRDKENSEMFLTNVSYAKKIEKSFNLIRDIHDGNYHDDIEIRQRMENFLGGIDGKSL